MPLPKTAPGIPLARVDRGCTLFEIMIVLGVFSILMGSCSVIAFHQLERAKESQTHAAMRKVIFAANRWAVAQPGARRCSLDVLVRDGYLAQAPRDGWGRPLRLLRCDTSGVLVFSSGNDRRFHTEDDLTSWHSEEKKEPQFLLLIQRARSHGAKALVLALALWLGARHLRRRSRPGPLPARHDAPEALAFA